MIKIENLEVVGIKNAVRGMRNPMNSWDKSDSRYTIGNTELVKEGEGYAIIQTAPGFVVGDNDLNLMNRLSRAGTDHRKFMRMITVYMDITAPLYWWKEFDTYKVGTVANSCSTMHKITEKEFTIDDFSHEHLLKAGDIEICFGDWITENVLEHIIQILNIQREKYLKTKDKKFWWQIIQLLPSSYNQKRTIMLNYEVLANMYQARKCHKLDEWCEFCEEIEKLPYSELITKK